MNDKETRTFDIKGLEAREPINDDFIGQIGGYAVVFNEPSEDMGGFIEYISPRAFDNVDMSDVIALFNHNFENVLGRTSSDTLKLEVDNKGLKFTLDIPNTTLGNDVYVNIRAGNLKSMSFKFVLGQESWARGIDGTPERTIDQIEELHEVSVVTLPSYSETTVAVTRSLKTNVYKQKILAVLKLYE